MTIQIVKNLNDEDVVIISNEDGSQISMLKSTYDALQAAQANPAPTAQ